MPYQPQTTAPSRVVGFGLVVALHILVVYGLYSGLAKSVVEVLKGPIETKVIEELKKDEPPPPPPPPKFDEPPPPFVPPPEISVELPAAPAESTAINTQSQVKAAPPSSAVPPRSDPRRPNSQPEYPPTSRRLGEAGTVVLLLLVDTDGRVKDARVDKSSGFERLDEAAVRESKSRWRFIPGSQDGKPVEAWTRVAVTFKLTN